MCPFRAVVDVGKKLLFDQGTSLYSLLIPMKGGLETMQDGRVTCESLRYTLMKGG